MCLLKQLKKEEAILLRNEERKEKEKSWLKKIGNWDGKIDEKIK